MAGVKSGTNNPYGLAGTEPPRYLLVAGAVRDRLQPVPLTRHVGGDHGYLGAGETIFEYLRVVFWGGTGETKYEYPAA